MALENWWSRPAVVSTCTDMCHESEIELRQDIGQIDPYEQVDNNAFLTNKSLAVKTLRHPYAHIILHFFLSFSSIFSLPLIPCAQFPFLSFPSFPFHSRRYPPPPLSSHKRPHNFNEFMFVEKVE